MIVYIVFDSKMNLKSIHKTEDGAQEFAIDMYMDSQESSRSSEFFDDNYKIMRYELKK